MVIKIRDERQMKALTGLSFAEFDRLLPVFKAVCEAQQQRRYEQAVQAGTHRRKPCPGAFSLWDTQWAVINMTTPCSKPSFPNL